MMNVHFLQARRDRGLKQTEVAKLAGCQQSDVSMIEAQAWIPPPELQERLAAVLETTAEALFWTVVVRAS